MVSEAENISKFWGKNNRINSLKKKLTDVEIAKQLNITPGNLYKIKMGTMNVYLHRLVQIAEVIKCKPADLLPPEWTNPQTDFSITEDDSGNIEYIMGLIEEIEDERSVKLDNKTKARLLIALFVQLKNRYDNDNQSEELDYQQAFSDAIIK